MGTKRTGYLMAMLAGLAIVGASTGGVVAATSHHDVTLAAEQSQAAAALESSAAAATPVSPSPGQASASPAPVSATAGAASSLATPPVTTAPTAPTAPTTVVPGPAAGSGRRAAAPAGSSPQAAPSPAVPSTTASKAPALVAAAVALKYKNGQYTATGSYNCPSGTEKLGVTITLASDKVVKSDLALLGGAGLSHSFQQAFQSGYAPQVIGKDIDSVSVGAVAGSSLTSSGFNDALKQIESQAKT